MAGDWIKMRGSLLSAPKVIAITALLLQNRGFREWLTPGGGGAMNGQTVSDEALRCVTVALLLRVWSVAREHGHYVGDDLVFPCITIDDIDQIANVDGMGAAMAAVGWAVESEDGCGVTLPHFKEYNVPLTPAEKQKGFRDRKKGVTKALPCVGNSALQNVTPREEKRREEYRGMNSPITPSCTETEISVSVPLPVANAPRPETILTFPCDGPVKAWELTASQIDEWRAAYPSLDVPGECRKALAWVNAAPERKKTARGMTRFLVGWLGRAQDSPRRAAVVPSATQTPEDRQAARSARIKALHEQNGIPTS